MKILFAVTNDLSQDQRMNRICKSLQKAGHEVELVGRKRKRSLPLNPMSFRRVRLNCFFEKGKLFYIEYNLRLFLYSIFKHPDVFGVIDLDTALPFLLCAKFKQKKLVYDAHEYFTEMEEVVERPAVQKTWKQVEKWLVPSIDLGYTVSSGYAELFEKEYKKAFSIIRNATVLKAEEPNLLKEGYLLYQGAVNYGRGLFHVLDALELKPRRWIICGEGDALQELKNEVKRRNLTEYVEFKGFVEPAELVDITQKASVGLTLFEKKGLSHIHSLANRFFDYFHAAVPQLAMAYPEYQKFNQEFEVGLLLNSLQAEEINKALDRLFDDHLTYSKIQQNCLAARKMYNWQNEEHNLLALYQKL